MSKEKLYFFYWDLRVKCNQSVCIKKLDLKIRLFISSSGGYLKRARGISPNIRQQILYHVVCGTAQKLIGGVDTIRYCLFGHGKSLREKLTQYLPVN